MYNFGVVSPGRSLAFSLVELSIVLVILGLLTGGILAGQSLIHASELRSVGRDFDRYQTAFQSFRDRYFGLPGDLPNAESFWGVLAVSNGMCRDTPSTGLPTCNGDGDGVIHGTWSTRSYEKFRAWQHLANAGLIEGSYSGTANGSVWIMDSTNSPLSRISGSVWGMMPVSYTSGVFADSFFPANSVNYLCIVLSGMPCGGSNVGALKAEDAWNLDMKLDDGKPASGRVTSGHNYRYPNCTTTDASDSTYKTSNTTSGACPLYFGI